MFSNGMTIRAPSASIVRLRASRRSFSLAAAATSPAAICGGNSSSFFEPSMKWMMMPRFSLIDCLPVGSHRLQLARAQRDALADVEAIAVAPAHGAPLAAVHDDGHLVVHVAQALAHVGRAGGA